MKALVTVLRAPKPGATLDMCDDFAAYDCARGRFAVADGVAVGFFSGLWAQALVNQFVDVPLVNADPFELRWWRDEAVRSFEETRAPVLKTLDPVNQQDAEQDGSHSTLLTLRFDEVGPDLGTVQLLAVGDSCAFVALTATGRARSFPLSSPDQFTMSPATVASVWQPHQPTVSAKVGKLLPGALVILATDGVSEWLLRWPERGLTSLRAAMDELAAIDVDAWPAYLVDAQTRGMARDDATALIVQLLPDDAPEGEPLCAAPAFDRASTMRRQQQYDHAAADQDVRALAAAVGDCDLSPLTFDRTAVDCARRTVVALDTVLLALRHHIAHGAPNLVRSAWEQHADLLADAPAAEKLRGTLRHLGFLPEVVAPVTPCEAESPLVELSEASREAVAVAVPTATVVPDQHDEDGSDPITTIATADTLDPADAASPKHTDV